MTIRQMVPQLTPTQIASYSALFIFLQILYVCIQTSPSILQRKQMLSASRVFTFGAAIAIPFGVVVFLVVHTLMTCGSKNKN